MLTIPGTDLSDQENEPTSNLSLRALMDLITGRTPDVPPIQEDSGFADHNIFPFMAIVGQEEMKTALLLSLINPLVGGVLLIGARGTGKTTAVRSLTDLLPPHTSSACYYGCRPEDIESGGMSAVCPDCAQKYGQGIPLTRIEPGCIVELPLNARLEDVIGGFDERSALHERLRIKRGLLARADQNILYIDEVNLLQGDIINAILDAAALGSYTVHRGPISATYKACFTLMGSMNPEVGNLSSQILDRFGLRVVVRGLESVEERLETYRRVRAYRYHPGAWIARFSEMTHAAQVEIDNAQKALPDVELPDEVALHAVKFIRKLKIDSIRAEVTLLEAARAFAAADARSRVELSDLKRVIPMALRLRQSPFMQQYFKDQSIEDQAFMNL